MTIPDIRHGASSLALAVRLDAPMNPNPTRRNSRVGAALAGASLLLATPLQAQDASTPTPAQAATQAAQDQTNLINAQTGLINAQSANAKAQIDALGLGGATGKTDLKDKAGEMEGMMLATGSINAAATIIGDTVAKIDGAHGRPILLLGSGQTVDLTVADTLPHEAKALRDAVNTALAAAGCERRPAGPAMGLLPIGGAAVASVALGLLRQDTEITGFDLGTMDAALIDALAGTHLGKENGDLSWIVPGDAVRFSKDNPVIKDFDDLLAMREEVARCEAKLEASTKIAKTAAAATERLAPIAAVRARADAWIERVSAPRDKGPSELAAAAIAAALDPTGAGVLVLHVKVEKAGGSVLKRANLWTMLGAPAVGITGGLVVHWRLSDGTTGKVQASQLLVCRTALTSLNAIQDGKAGPSGCGTSTVASSALK